MLLDAERLSHLFHLHTEDDVQVFGFLGSLFVKLSSFVETRIVGILDKISSVTTISCRIYALFSESRGAIIKVVILTCEIYHWTRFTCLIDNEERRNASSLSHLGIVRTKRRRDVYDTRTIFSGHIVTRDYAESLISHFHKAILSHREDTIGVLFRIFAHKVCSSVSHLFRRTHPRHQLNIAQAHEFRTFITCNNTIRHHFIADSVVHFSIFAFSFEISRHAVFCNNSGDGLCRVRIEGLQSHIVNVRTYAQCSVGRQSPRCGCPRQEHRLTPPLQCFGSIHHLKLRSDSGIFHITICTRLIEFVTRKSSSSSRAIRLNGITFVEQTLLIELFEQPPESFDIRVFVSDVRVFHIHPIPHKVRQIAPLLRVHHHITTTMRIIFFDRNLLTNVFFGNSQFLFNTQFDGQTMGVPTSFAVDLETLHRFVTAKHILNGTRHHVVNTRVSICRWRSFKENIRGATFTLADAAVEEVGLVPFFQHLFVDGVEVHTTTFGEFLTHI